MALPRITIEGRVVADPELRFAPSGVAVGKFRMVASDRRKNDAGEWEDSDTLWMSVTVFKQLAEEVAEHIQKGHLVTVVGKIKTDEWTNEAGEKRTAVAMIADSVARSVQFMSGSRSSSGTSDAAAVAARGYDGPAVAAQAEEPPF